MNGIIGKCSLSGDEFMPEIHLRQPGFTYSACEPFIKNKACFQFDMACGYFKVLNRRTLADDILRDKAFNIAKNQTYDAYQCGLASMVYKCLIENFWWNS